MRTDEDLASPRSYPPSSEHLLWMQSNHLSQIRPTSQTQWIGPLQIKVGRYIKREYHPILLPSESLLPFHFFFFIPNAYWSVQSKSFTKWSALKLSSWVNTESDKQVIIAVNVFAFFPPSPCTWMENIIRTILKGYSTQKWKFCHHLLTLQVVANLYDFLIYAEHKGRYFDEQLNHWLP